MHYYFGSVEQLLVRVLERFTERLTERQRQLYAADVPFSRGGVRQWRTSRRIVRTRRVVELQALAWNRPSTGAARAGQRRVAHSPQRGVRRVREQLGFELPLAALVSLVYTFNEGIMLERLSGIETGHRELLDWIDRWLETRTA